jgi:hypothetical protein
LVLESEVHVGEHVQTGRELFDGRRDDAQFAALRLARMPDEADNITALDLIVQLFEFVRLTVVPKTNPYQQSQNYSEQCRKPGVGHHLQSNTFAAQIVENELRTGLAFRMHAT